MRDTLSRWQETDKILNKSADLLKCQPNDVIERVLELQARIVKLRREVAAARKRLAEEFGIHA